ncbi:myb/sant-like dna-binding domain [Holotrichia oblita]|nr:myb/sant-like dna-binding domain [Holotrichia oblita]
MKKRMKTLPTKWSLLLDFIESHPEMITKKFSGPLGKQTYDRLCEEISTQLNSMGFAYKTSEKWQEACTKWKSKVKTKAQALCKEVKATGGGGDRSKYKRAKIDGHFRLESPPPLLCFSTSNTTLTSAVSPTSNATTRKETNSKENWEQPTENYQLPRKTSSRKRTHTQRKNSIKLDDMHKENMEVLEEISSNLKQLVDTQQQQAAIFQQYLEYLIK